jgi:hypothetical protein
MKDLGIVANVAACCMMVVIILGSYYDALIREHKVQTVPCSITIENMARKLNVVLLDECKVTE